MIRLLLLLLGARAIQRRWRPIVAVGALWFLLGLLIFLDALDGVTLFPIRDVGYLLIIEGLVGLLAASLAAGRLPRRARLVEGVLLLFAGLLTIEAPWRSDVALALLLGTLFAVDGAVKLAAARLIRFPGWRATQAEGLLSLVLAILTLQPWPTWYVGTIGCNVGIALMISGWNAMRLGHRVRRMAPDAPIASLLSHAARPWIGGPVPQAPRHAGCDLVVHVWTPSGGAPARRPVIDRYIAAVDTQGVISTGHAALEHGADVYISHYPAVEIDRSPGQFRRVLRGTADNDVPGRFQTSLAEEVAGWCEPTEQVRFRHFDADRLARFWAQYRADPTYNLTIRNCSSGVAQALDAALEGQLVLGPTPRRRLLQLLVSPQLWLAAMLRARAEAVAWTPGLLLDYASALSAVMEPPSTRWTKLVRRAIGRRRHHGRPRGEAPAEAPGA